MIFSVFLLMNEFLEVTIRYLIDGSAFSWDFWLVLFVGAAFSALFIYRGRDLKRCIVIPLLLAYITMMLNLTILSREPHIAYRFNFQPFCYLESSSKTALYYAILNYIFFVPLGFLLEALQKKRRVWITVLACFSFSVLIEATQLFLKLGLADFDDIFENTIGALLGALIYQGIAVLIRKIRVSSP